MFWSHKAGTWWTQSARSAWATYYRWRQEFGGLKIEQVKRLKDLELENSRLRKAVSDLTLDKLILQEAARGNF
jgi:putative transposase